ncbi:hypothetical protein CDO44_26900 [Pigmentiphaga sp. NML080357]|uniref:hybrid sensor histidine kinase/response regulator n=1 Tax=Pigmentiphaga sp. NML080357 TaxID=2008675 RepID=UPI000B41A5BD|nr:hybrid sensor histidine kinase/response regulator [Pigmentiphaga sp. NML080357]OVZ54373.1 hypothetical protein CDO44_26900 [Pigmentiphaga sp. NML080357]
MSRSVKILVVDDIEENIVAMEALVRRPDVELLRANSGTTALELLLEHDVALALLDVHMPGMDGYELAELMRGSPRTRHVPIIFLTAADRSAHRTFRGYEAGAVDFLYKPLEPHILRTKIDVFVELQQQRLQLAEQLDKLTQLLRTNEMFVAVLGHDLRNPLSAVVNISDVLIQTAADGQTRDWATRIKNSGHRMARMVDQLLDLAHMRTGAIAISNQPIDLAELCGHIVQELDPLGDKRSIKLEHWGNTRGTWDRDRLQQVFSNLVGNALQHGMQHAPVSVSVDGTKDETVTVKVCNAGTLDPEVRTHLFQPFAAAKIRPRASGGLGLGLYIAKELVAVHQGQLTVNCETEGLTIFEVVLPRRCDATRAGIASPLPAPAANPHR